MNPFKVLRLYPNYHTLNGMAVAWDRYIYDSDSPLQRSGAPPSDDSYWTKERALAVAGRLPCSEDNLTCVASSQSTWMPKLLFKDSNTV